MALAPQRPDVIAQLRRLEERVRRLETRKCTCTATTTTTAQLAPTARKSG